MPPNAPAPANGVATANGCFWMTMPRRIGEELRFLRAALTATRALTTNECFSRRIPADLPEVWCSLQRGGHLVGQCFVCLLELTLDEESVPVSATFAHSTRQGSV
jgi:hypothetical protein